MKKITVYIFMIALATVLFTACGSKRGDTATDTSTEVPVETGNNTIAQAPSDTESDIRNNTAADTIISEEEAKGVALKDANLADSDISKFRIKLERDDGIQVYEVDFYSDEREYDYEIDAISGRILEKDEEPID